MTSYNCDNEKKLITNHYFMDSQKDRINLNKQNSNLKLKTTIFRWKCSDFGLMHWHVKTVTN